MRDAVALFAHLVNQEAVRTSTGHIHKSTLKALARSLSLPDERYASFLYALCREAQFIAPRGDKQVYALTARGESWLYEDTTVQIQSLFTAWRNGLVWAEMVNDPLIKSGDYRPGDSILTLRQAALALVASCPTDAFYDISSLADMLTYHQPLLLAQSAVMGADLVASPVIFVRRLVAECLFWLGAVELDQAAMPASSLTPTPAPRKATTRGKSSASVLPKPVAPDATAYRLTPLGAYLLGLPDQSPPEPEPREEKFILQANAEVFLPPYLDPATLYQLLTLTELPAKDAAGNVVRLTPESIRRALDSGTSERDILRFLQTSVRTGIPQNIEYLINEVAGKHGHIHVGQAQMYLQTDSPLMLQELQARRELKPYFVRALSDTVALLKADDQEKLLRELRKAGYLPVSDDQSAPRQPRLFPPQNAPKAKLSTLAAAPKRKTVPPADSVIDWERIAREDDKPWNPSAAKPTATATKLTTLLRLSGPPTRHRPRRPTPCAIPDRSKPS